MPKSVLIVDDNEYVRRAMHGFFEQLSDWKIVGEAQDGVEAIRLAEKLNPDLILLDFSMPRLNGIEAASVLKKMLPLTQIVVFTVFDDALSSKLCLSAGVDLVVAKAEGLGGLVNAVQQLMGIDSRINGQASAD
jgi:DNA-binding NarL/FixJ family response regulator